MRARGVPTRLELHRLKFVHSGGLGPLLTMDELNDIERYLISNDFFSRAWVEGPERDPYKIYAEVLAGWGVMCPHPEEKVQNKGRHVQCECCGTVMRGGLPGGLVLATIAR